MCTCKICNLDFTDKKKLSSHIRYVHKNSVKEYYDLYIHDTDGKCCICGKVTSFHGLSGYSRFCSSTCSNVFTHTNRSIEEKNKINSKISSTLVANQSIIKQTNIEKYGVEYTFQRQDVKNKIKQTNKERYGSENVFQSDLIKKKIKNTYLNKYGVDSISKLSSHTYNVKKTCLKKYGVDNVSKVDSIKNKIKIAHYNYINNFEKENNCTQVKKLIDEYGQMWYKNCKDIEFLYNSYDAFVKNEDIQKILDYIADNHHTVSFLEQELVKFIKTIYDGIIIENDRSIIKPYELDIYIPDKHIAIEFNGIYWHNSKNKSKNYHLMKTEMCEKKNIRLIHIFENEWINDKDICKSIISSSLGIYSKKIYARKCSLKEVSHKDSAIFLDQNHIQGSVHSKYNLGLYYNNELVQLICVGKSRFKNSENELLRMCSKKFVQVIGGFSKLLSHLPDEYKINLISFIDRSKFTGTGYSHNFIFVSNTPVSYFYYGNNKKLNRLAAQKHKLPRLLGDNFDESKTESDNMINNGYNKIYDCGNIKVKYNGCR